MKTVEEEIEELRQMKVPQLLARYREVFGKDSRVKHPDWLWKRIAWKIQENQYGGLSNVAKRRLEELMAEIHLPLDGKKPKAPITRRQRDGLAPGTVLVRRWKGQEVRVRVLEDAFEWNGTSYKSLSAVARAATGTNWNGPVFFGLHRPKK